MFLNTVLIAILALNAMQSEPSEPLKPADTPPDCRKLFERAVEAAKTVKTATYDVRRYGVGEIMGSKVPKISGHVMLEVLPEDKPLGVRLAIKGGGGDTGQENPFELVYDGKTFAILFSRPQVVFSGEPLKDRTILDREEHKLVLKELFLPSRYAQPLDALAYRYEGIKDVEGVSCHAILVEYEPEESRKLPRFHLDRKVIRTRWYLAKDDHLPRRIEWKLAAYPDLVGEQAEQGLEMVLSNLKINPPLEPDTFKLPQPAGSSSGTGGASAADSASTEQKTDTEKNKLSTDTKKNEDVSDHDKDGKQKRERPPKLEHGQLAPDFSLKDSQGREHKLSGYRGKVVVLDFWASWCRPCRDTMPGLEKFADDYKSKGVVVMSLNIEDDPTDALALLANRTSSILHLMHAKNVARTYRTTGIPDYLVLDRQGRLVQRVQGIRDNIILEITKVVEVALKQGDGPEGSLKTPATAPTP